MSEEAVQLLNDAKLETDGHNKVNKLKGVYELVVNKQPSLLEEFLPEVAELQVDPSPHVRKYLPDFLSGAAQARPTASVLQQCIQCTAGLLSDHVPAAAKQAVLSSNLLFRMALALVAVQGGDAQHAEQLRPLWEAAQGLKFAVAGMAAQHKNDGVRLNAAKFVEQAALLLTADSFPPVPGICQSPVQLQAGNQVVTKSAVVKDAEGLLSQLVALLKLRVGEDVSGPVAIVVVKSAGVIAQQRPQFLGKVLPAVLVLANSRTYKVDAAEGGMQSSVANALKGALLGVLRCTDPMAVTWRKKVVDAMHAMGAGALAETTVKQLNRGNKRSSSEEPEAAKRPRLGDPRLQQPAEQQQPAPSVPGLPLPPQQPVGQQPLGQPPFAHQPQGLQLPPSATPPLAAPAPLPPPTSAQDLDRVLTVMQALVANGDASTLAAIVGGLQPAVLADVVLTLIPTLPPRHALPPDHYPVEPWVHHLLQLLAAQTQPTPARAPTPPIMQHGLPQQQQQQQSFMQQPGPPPGQLQAPPWPQQIPPQQQQPPPGLVLHAPQQLGHGLQPPGLVAPHPPGPLQHPMPVPTLPPGPPAAVGMLHPTALPPGVFPPPAAAQAPSVAPAQLQQAREPTPPPQLQQAREPTPPPQQQAQPLQPPPVQAAKPAPRPPVVVPVFQLAPLPLEPQQQADLRRAAVLRILSTKQVASPALQRALVAKLAAVSGEGEHVGDAVLEFLLQDFAGRGGFELCMQWLHVLFAAECPPLGGADGAAAAPALDAASLAEFVNSGLGSFGVEGFLGRKAEDPQPSRPGAAKDPSPGSPAAGSAAADGSRGGSGQYQVVLLALLEGLKEALPPSDKTIIRVLLEAPSLPMPAVRHFLHDMCVSGPDWATLALLAAKDIIDQRSPSRQQVLGFVLEAAGDPTADVRSKAVRLTANRLFPQAAITAAIERHARQQLDSMVVRQPRPASAASAAPTSPAPRVAAPEGQHAASPSHAGMPPAEASDAGQRLPAEASEATGVGEAPDVGQPAAGGGGDGEPVERQQQQQQGEEAQPDSKEEAVATPAAVSAVGSPVVPADAGPTEAAAAQLCALYCALCTKKHSLLRHLFEVYGQTSDGGRAAIHRNAPGLAKTLGATAAALLAVVQDPPEGSLNLVINMLYVLTEAALPPPAVVTAGRQLFAGCKDARVLPPLLPGMEKAAALRLLPALLDLAPEALCQAVQRLVRPLPPAREPLFQPSELLVALHTLDTSADPGLLRKMMAGVSVCMASRELFDQEALAATISQLMTRAPLPPLFMRTVIQSLAAMPRLRGFVCTTLGQLVTRQVWNDANQWKGWLLCAQQAAPDSLPAWLQLPTAVLSQALQGTPQPFKHQLAAYATSAKCTQSVPRATLDVLKAFLPKAEGAESSVA